MNAKEEFLAHIKDRVVLCVDMYTEMDDWSDDGPTKRPLTLPVDHTAQEITKFIDSLDFEYDSGYGGQELFGIIWYTDGTWSTRGEYDGSEWWEYHICPSIPESLIKC